MIGQVSLNTSNMSYSMPAGSLNRPQNEQGSQDPQAKDTLEKQGVIDDAKVKANASSVNSDVDEEDPDVRREIQDLTVIEDKVIAHEQAHMSVGGEFAGGASYSYTVGPDGKRYISGGEVGISIPSVDDPEQMLRMLERVRQAAMAPADPSSQDLRVASSATSRMAKVNSEIAAKKADETYGTKEFEGTEEAAENQKEAKGPDNQVVDFIAYGRDGNKQPTNASQFSMVI